MDNQMKLKTIIILFFTLFSLSISSQTSRRNEVTGTQLAQHVKRLDTEIERMRSLSKSIAQTLDEAEARASLSTDPQRTLDFILLRYERNDSYVQLGLAEKAQEVVEYLSKHRHDNHGIADSAIQQGINKYSDMCSFFINRAKQLRSSFTKHWNAYSSKYGTSDQQIFVQDNNDLAKHGISTK